MMDDMVSPIRVVLADDHLFYREGVKAMLATRAEVEVVGEAASGPGVVAAVAELGPDVVLMDLGMPGLNGIQATRQILASHPSTAVLVLTMFDDESVLAAVRAGARGYLLKDVGVEPLVRAIVSVHEGETIFGPQASARLSGALRATTGSPPVFPELTEREHDVLRMIAAGDDNARIARELHLSAKTVRNYVATILSKLQVHDRAQAVAKARDVGLGDGRR